jgi:cytochrome b561
MSFRERTAWITAITIVVCFGTYYGALFTGLVDAKSWRSFHLGLGCIIALVVLQIALNLIAAVLNPKEARTPRDERERMIHARSHTVGYYVMMFGMAAVLVSTHIPLHGQSFLDVIFNTVYLGVLVMVIAALSVAIAQIIMFRRGS